MNENDSDLLVLREAMAFNGERRPLDPKNVILGARRRQSWHRVGAVVATVAVTAAVGVGASAVIDAPREPVAPTSSGAPNHPVETVDANGVADLGHGWYVTSRPGRVCLRLEDDDESCHVGIGVVEGGDYTGGGIAGWYKPATARAPLLVAWLVPADTSTAELTAGDGSRLPADVYALTDAPGAHLAVVFIEDETTFWQQPNRRLTSYDSTGAVVAHWPVLKQRS